MKKYVFIILILVVAIGAFVYYNFFYKPQNNSSNENSLGTRISTNSVSNDTNNLNSVIENNTNSTNNSTSSSNSTSDNNNSVNESAESTQPKTTESEIASFSTTIYTKDEERQNNLSIACSTLNDTIVEAGSTFSFSDTLGKATSSKGYEKADVFQDGEVVQALGGGMCQISTTLYNAVLEVPDLDVTERHEHSNDVPYIESGKDAAVAYGSYDLKFVNNTGSQIKIKASNTKDKVSVKILKIKEQIGKQ